MPQPWRAQAQREDRRQQLVLKRGLDSDAGVARLPTGASERRGAVGAEALDQRIVHGEPHSCEPPLTLGGEHVGLSLGLVRETAPHLHLELLNLVESAAHGVGRQLI